MIETNWQTSLVSQDAVIKDGAIQHFGGTTNELETTTIGNTLCDLSHLGLLVLSGDDATTFLQGQVTNDVTQLNGNNAHYSAYCSPKGRMLALFLALSHRGSIYLQFSRPILAPIMKRLNMYIMRSKVEISDASNDILRFGVNGSDASNIVTKALGKTPKEDFTLVATERAAAIQLPSIKGQSRYEILADAAHAFDIWNTLKMDCTPVGKPCWDWLEIQTGCPEVLVKTQEQFVPQMLNLDTLNGISFKKGCYTGQEIVARTHYLGKVKRHMYLATITTSEQPIEGDKVTDANGNEVGQIVKSSPNLNNNFDALVEVRIEAKEAGNVLWNGTPVSFDNLPYEIAG